MAAGSLTSDHVNYLVWRYVVFDARACLVSL